jgi:hypothetical protein
VRPGLVSGSDRDEIAKVALFPAPDLVSYVRGAAIPVDGGFLSAWHALTRSAHLEIAFLAGLGLHEANLQEQSAHDCEEPRAPFT